MKATMEMEKLVRKIVTPTNAQMVTLCAMLTLHAPISAKVSKIFEILIDHHVLIWPVT